MNTAHSPDFQRPRDEPTREVIREGLLLHAKLGRSVAFRFMTDHGVPPVIATRALLSNYQPFSQMVHIPLNTPRYENGTYGEGVLFQRPSRERDQAFLITSDTLRGLVSSNDDQMLAEQNIVNCYLRYSDTINKAADTQLALIQRLVSQKKMVEMPDVLTFLADFIEEEQLN